MTVLPFFAVRIMLQVPGYWGTKRVGLAIAVVTPSISISIFSKLTPSAKVIFCSRFTSLST